MTKDERIAEAKRYERLADTAGRGETPSINSPVYYRKRATEHRQPALAGS